MTDLSIKIISQLKKLPILFFAVLILYNINLREISSGDTLPSRYLPISIITGLNLDLDEFPYLYNTKTNSEYFYIQNSKGHWLSSYPVMPAILSVPVYIPAVIFNLTGDPRWVNLFSKFASSAIVSLSALFMFMTLKLILSEDMAILISLLYAFATSNWSVASQGLWQHGPVELCLSIALYFLVKGDKWIYLASPFLALAVAARMSTALIAGGLFLYVIVYHRKEIIKFAFSTIPVALLLFTYNLYYFGNLTGGNARLESKMLELKPIASVWSANFLPGLTGLLISPSRGLLIFSPVIVFSFAGIYYIFKNGAAPLYKYLSAISIFYILLFSFYTSWWGGHTYGYRYLIDIVPFLCIFIAFAIEKIMSSKRLKLIFTLLFCFSIFVQVIGFFNYPDTWNSIPKDVDIHPERVWDVTDNQIIRCLRNGGRLPEFLKKVN